MRYGLFLTGQDGFLVQPSAFSSFRLSFSCFFLLLRTLILERSGWTEDGKILCWFHVVFLSASLYRRLVAGDTTSLAVAFDELKDFFPSP